MLVKVQTKISLSLVRLLFQTGYAAEAGVQGIKGNLRFWNKIVVPLWELFYFSHHGASRERNFSPLVTWIPLRHGYCRESELLWAQKPQIGCTELPSLLIYCHCPALHACSPIPISRRRAPVYMHWLTTQKGYAGSYTLEAAGKSENCRRGCFIMSSMKQHPEYQYCNY